MPVPKSSRSTGIPAARRSASSWRTRLPDSTRPASVSSTTRRPGATRLREFAAQALMAISRNRVAPGRLVVELTEAGLVESGSRVRHELADLRAAGIPVLLDDFGTGIAPLSYLRDLPVDGVKLDMSFTAGIPEDPAAARVSRALGALAREMGLITIAEGIETPEQARFLRECGWHYGQGWLFGAGESERVTVGAVEHT